MNQEATFRGMASNIGGHSGNNFIDYLWSNSGSGSTTWTNNGDSSFSVVNEPPITLMSSKSKNFQRFFKKMQSNAVPGDRIFAVLAHGCTYDISDSRPEDKGLLVDRLKARSYDKVLRELSPEYSKVVDNLEPFTLVMISCNSANTVDSDRLSIADNFSRLHPNATILDSKAIYTFPEVKK